SRSPPPPLSTLFPYTTLFRSDEIFQALQRRARLAGQPMIQLAGEVVGIRVDQGMTKRGLALEVIVERAFRHTDRAQNLIKPNGRSEEHTSELQSRENLVCRLL